MFIQLYRGLKSALDTKKNNSTLKVGEPYYLTDTKQIAVGNSVNDYTIFPNQTEVDGKQVIHGFENRTDSTLSFVDGTRTFTITGTNFKVWNKGVLQTKNTGSIVIANTIGVHFVYYNSSNVLTTGTTAWTIGTDMPIALVLWNGTNGLIAEERHRSSETHEYLHNVFHTMYSSGLSATFGNSTFQVDNGVIYDEDIKISIPTTTQARVFYRSGTDLLWTAKQTNYMQVNAGYYYDNAGTLTAVGSNNYFAIWIYGTDLVSDGIIAILGQRQDTTIGNARTNNTPESLNTSFLPVPEMKLLYRVICRNNATSYIETTDYRTTTITGSNITATDHQTLTNRSAADSHPASAITNTPSGNIASTDVQSAINELDSEKQAVLVSGTNIKTINSTSLLGSGDIAVQPTLVSGTNIKTINSTSLLGSGDIAISGGGITTYTVTTANCENTTTETTVASFTIPANTWNNGDIIMFRIFGKAKNNSGSNVNFDFKLYKDSLLLTRMLNNSLGNAATENLTVQNVMLMRIGNDVFMCPNGYFFTAGWNNFATYIYQDDATTVSTSQINQYVDGGTYDFNFAADITIKINIKWSVANSTVYFRPFDCLARKM